MNLYTKTGVTAVENKGWLPRVTEEGGIIWEVGIEIYRRYVR